MSSITCKTPGKNSTPEADAKPTIRLQEVFSPEWLANPLQREYFCQRTTEILSRAELVDLDEVLKHCLSSLWTRYDLGGISCWRSVRSVLLEWANRHLRSGNVEDARRCISHLIAINLDPEYIRNHNWYDFSIEEFPYGALDDLTILTLAWLILEIDVLPDVRQFRGEDAYRLAEWNAVSATYTK